MTCSVEVLTRRRWRRPFRSDEHGAHDIGIVGLSEVEDGVGNDPTFVGVDEGKRGLAMRKRQFLGALGESPRRIGQKLSCSPRWKQGP